MKSTKEKDQALIETMKRIADGVASVLGRHCEVVIHDFANLDRSLVHIAGNVTNRVIGAPITDLAYKRYKDARDAAEDLHGYRTVSGNGRVLRSSTSFLRNDAGKVIGCFCVNFDMTDFLNAKALLDDFTQFEDESEGGERFANAFNETVEALIDEAVTAIGRQPATMERESRLDLVERLDSRDVFLFKGAVNQVARLFGVSRYTVYNYLKEVRARNGVR
ncbi:MAG: transcriptional regulator [Desulfovibrionaceae bacterium]